MDLEYLKKLAGIGGQSNQYTVSDVNRELSERRKAMMQSVMQEAKEEKLELIKLPYNTTDLKPALSKENIEYHYSVLSQGYVTRYNNKEGDPDFNYGGAKLHNLWWGQLKKPDGSNQPVGYIKETIENRFGGYDNFKEEFLKTAMALQGSGWAYLSKQGTLKTTPNQSYKTDILMPVDMWEHSFMDYVPAKDAKKQYITNIFKVMNWDVINNRLEG
tara:strand:+ start:7557 stop:8204 length:648 start_codon:yes stop_codon:yes gene_type:complete